MSRGSIIKTSKTSDLRLLSKITYGWVGGFLDLCRAMKGDPDKEQKNISLDNEDVSVPVDIEAASQRSDFSAAFERNAGDGQWRKTIFELGRKTFVSDVALQLTSTGTMLLVPNLTARLVDWLPLVEKMAWWKPYAMVLLIWSILIVRSLCQNYGITLSAIAACRFSFGLTGAVHQKMTRLSEASKQKFGGGSVANLMAMDPLRFNIVMTVMPHLIIAPFQIVGSIGLLSYYVGWTALAGLVVILMYLPFQYTISKRLDGIRESYSKVADDRLRLTRETFESIRLIKFFGWEETFISRILNVREKELASVKTILTLSAVTLCLAIWLPALGGVLIVSLHSWRTISTGAGKIDPGVTYMILSIMTYLIAPVYIIPVFSSVLIAAKVSAKRLDEFFESPERIGLIKESSDSNIIEVKEAEFEWESLDKDSEEGKPGSKLSNVNLSIPRGSLVVLVGPVASGKSSLLSALLGEMRKTSGEATINLPADQNHFAYCRQQAWLMAGTVRDNVLFGRLFNPQLYSQALMESCLFPDLKSMANGDATEIGENGAGLSGGQKQRISLARALYSQSELYLLDDPLSALDASVAHTILNKCIVGGMIKEKTRLLVTHQIGLLVGLPEGSIDMLVVMEENRMTYVGPYDASKLDSSSFSAHSGPIDDNINDEEPVNDNMNDEEPVNDNMNDEEPVNDNINDEEPVNTSSEMLDQMVADMVKDGNPTSSEASKLPISTDQSKVVLYLYAAGWSMLLITVCFCLAEASGITRDLYIRASLMVDAIIKPSELRQIILVYIGLCLSQGIFSYIRMIIFGRLVSTRVARTTHESVLRSVCNTTFAFFDQTSIGDLASRFGKDMGSVDVSFPEKTLQMLGGFGAIVSTMVLLCIALTSSARLEDLLKYLGILIIGLTPVLFALRSCWVRFTSGWPAIQALVGQNTGELIASSNETLSGLSTITAYNASSMFDQRILRKIEATERSFFLVNVLERWLNSRVDACSASMVGVTMLLSLFGKIEASLAGLLILYSLNAAFVVAWFVSTMAETQSELFAFDRVMALAMKLRSETALTSSKLSIVPPPSWPQSGAITFKDLYVKYRAELRPVLKGVSLSIEPGQKVALVGRTGSGKSSLIAALYRVMEPESGWIEVDGIDTTQIPLSTLRHALSIVPQDPVLFAGTLRFNMDPEGEHIDEQIWSALRETGMENEVQDLDSRVEENGANFSTGQRQLLCLARALLRPSRILVIDEATANVDHETDKRIQAVLREHVKRTGCTLITVAHRISTIIDYDMIAVLDAGSLIEYGRPAELLAIQGGAFKSLADKAHDPSSPH